MGLLSYKFIGKNIVEKNIKSNNEMLSQFKYVADTYILDNVNQLSIKIMQDLKINPNISYYLRNPLHGHLVNVLNVDNYLSSVKYASSNISMLGLYYKYNDLAISTDFIRYEYTSNISSNDKLKYLKELIAAGKYYDNACWSFDTNYPYETASQSYNSGNSKYEHTNVILYIRKIPESISIPNSSGAIIIVMKETVLYNIIKSITPSGIDKIIVIDDEGKIISHSDKNNLGRNIIDYNFGNKILKSGNKSDYFIDNISGISSVISYTTSDYNKWRYITITPMANYTSATGFLTKTIIIISLLTVLLALVISIISARNFSSPVKNLVNYCRQISNNPELKSKNEFFIIKTLLNNMSSLINTQEKRFISSLPLLKQNFVQNMITNNLKDKIEIQKRMEMLEIDFPYKNYYVISALLTSQKDDNIVEYELNKINLKDDICKCFNRKNIRNISTEYNNYLVFIINSELGYQNIIDEILPQIKEYENNSTSKIHMGIGNQVEDMTLLYQSFNQSISALKYRYVYPEKMVFTVMESDKWDNNDNEINCKILKKIIQGIQGVNKKNTLNAFDDLFFCFQQQQLKYSYIINVLIQCISLIESLLSGKNTTINEITGIKEDIYNQFYSNTNVIEAKKWFEGISIKIIDYFDGKNSAIPDELINKAKEFILENIHRQDLSLNMVANNIFISPNYLSKQFKTEEGVLFIDYVNKLRMDKACELLLSTSYSISKISALTGFSSSQYFIKKFKYTYGMTPNNFRHATVNKVDMQELGLQKK